MFEVILSNIKSGRVIRKVFDNRAAAEEHIDKFFTPKPNRKPERRNFRIEVVFRVAPEVHARRTVKRAKVAA